MKSIIIVIGILSTGLFQTPAAATDLHVPSQYLTIQLAVDAAANSGDAIIVEAGAYSENVVITSKTLDIVGAGLTATSATSFTWTHPSQPYGPGGSLSDFHVDNDLLADIGDNFAIHRCSVGGITGIEMGMAFYVDAILDASVFQGSVTITGHSDPECLPSANAQVSGCEFHGSLSLLPQFCNASIVSSTFIGSADVSLTTRQHGTVSGNTFLGSGGITVNSNDGSMSVTDNVMSGGAISGNYIATGVDVLRNTGVGTIQITDGNQGTASIQENVVRSGGGIQLHCRNGNIRRNVVSMCSLGIRVAPTDSNMGGNIENNTVYGCTGAGVDVHAANTTFRFVVQRNLVTRNGTGIEFINPPGADHVLCNDVVDNAGGNWVGADYSGVGGNFALDPFLCGPATGDFTLAANSPCLPGNGTCGLVGALGAGCSNMGACCQPDDTCTITTEANCQGSATWQGAGSLCDPNPCTPAPCGVVVTVPNGGQDWPRGSQQTIMWTRSGDCANLVRIELLRNSPGHSSQVPKYQPCRIIAPSVPNTGSYAWTVERCGAGTNKFEIRIVELSTNATDTSDQPFSISGSEPTADLYTEPSQVAVPTPFQSDGWIHFRLAESGLVRAAVYNVHGQRVCDLINGPYPAGQHQASWDARTNTGEAAVAGVYYLRVQLGKTQFTRKLVLVR